MNDYLTYLKAAFEAPWIKAVIAAVSAFLLDIFGASWMVYQILFLLVVLDSFTGFMVGVQNKAVSSRKFMRTGKKLLVYMILILSSHQITRLVGDDSFIFLFGNTEEYMTAFLACTELLSILENAHKLGLPIPLKIKEKLESYIDGS